MDDPPLVGLLHGPADVDEQPQPVPRGQVDPSQSSVIGTPLTSSITKYGRPAPVAPASRTRAMFGWSTSACRSASNRAITARLSMPALITFNATRRRTGCCCSAM